MNDSIPPIAWLLPLYSFLFVTGLWLVITRQSIIFIILGIELMVQAAVANYITFDGLRSPAGQGQVCAILATVAAICEGTVLLAVSLWLYQKNRHNNVNKKTNSMHESPQL